MRPLEPSEQRPRASVPAADRRQFLLALGSGILSWPTTLAALDRHPVGSQGTQDFWTEVRAAFLLPEDRIYLNNGTLGPQPRAVMEAVEEYGRRVAETLPPPIPWAGLRDSLASLLGGDPDGFIVPRNTTEAMALVANGLELGPGHEVVITDHEHIGGRSAWELVAARRGATLIQAPLPVPASSSAELLDAVWSKVTSATRVVSVSHVLFTNGTVLPVRELAGRCREEGIVFVVDGAHPPGLLPLDIGGIGPDFYASSPHKWLLAPQGTGLLWMAPRWRDRLWPTIPSGDWAEPGPRRFDHVGTVDGSRVVGLLAALEFHHALGAERVWGRIQELQQHLRRGLATIPGVRLRSPEPNLTAGMVSFQIDGVDALALQGELARRARIRTRVIGEYGLGWMRLSTHVYNQPGELDRVLDLLDEASRRGRPSPGSLRP
jgi:selenocysteine lyase/cysteine desulfurase